jgi:hypothetical protein
MTSKTEQYRTILENYESVYGDLDPTNKPTIISITGPYRNKLYQQRTWGYYAVDVMYIIAALLTSFYLANPLVIVFVTAFPYLMVKSLIFDPEKAFDGEIIVVNGKKIGVLMQSQETEGKMESRNFVQTNDRRKLMNKLNEAGITFNEQEVVTWSIGSTTGQCINGKAPYAEVEMGIDVQEDATMRAFLKAHAKKLSHNGVLVLMNSVGYGVDEKAGIVYSDNKVEYENISRNIVARSIGGTGNNEAAMKFISKMVKFHQEGDYNYVLAVVPRGDKSMPQGGSHSKQRVLEHILCKRNAILIEVSGKQTKMFELQDGLYDDDLEVVCRHIKESKITDATGRSYGSGVVFIHLSLQ